MGAKVRDIVDIMEQIAPFQYAEDWDNVGLLLGDMEENVSRIMLTLDATPEVIEQAVKEDIDMLISHHPIIFKPIKDIRLDSYTGKILCPLIKHDISVLCAHTNLDKALGGVDDTLADILGLNEVEPLTYVDSMPYYKIVVYIPKGHEEKVLYAMAEAGAGCIGGYSHCTFQGEGTGTFLPLEGAKPYIGDVGMLEHVHEIRLETIVPKSHLDKVLDAMLKVHPYEEVAYDVYQLANRVKVPSIGRIGQLPKVMSVIEYAEYIKRSLNAGSVAIVGNRDKKVKWVGSCAGAGGDLVGMAKYKGADVFVTGELKYHEAQMANALGIPVIAAGHFSTEIPIVSKLITSLQKALDGLQYRIEVIVPDKQVDPYYVF
ncbi:Nif3-like dinuclear metal center hexameric protein [Xylanivirga thermophila]|uniref:Nif3-like dinuclear metal center hexameric protein n=1 Tax=Xylanivirga thermophila TaxID=2496273 RepID=UPI00101DB412|nr:Nif3-like dinuclear metal center hexameric protein [Xylanivirga thermophila]